MENSLFMPTCKHEMIFYKIVWNTVEPVYCMNSVWRDTCFILLQQNLTEKGIYIYKSHSDFSVSYGNMQVLNPEDGRI